MRTAAAQPREVDASHPLAQMPALNTTRRKPAAKASVREQDLKGVRLNQGDARAERLEQSLEWKLDTHGQRPGPC